jgi:putative transposase
VGPIQAAERSQIRIPKSPGVSDDNAHIEAWFRTGKYRSDYPVTGFASIEEARTWVHGLVGWYNDTHRHSAIGFVTPSERHAGNGDAILAQRRAVYEAAKARHPHRWSRHTRRWDAPATVWLNPPPKTEAAPWPQAA